MESWTFCFVADMHVGTPRSYRFQPAWNENWNTARRQIVDLAPDFLLVGGDMTRDGATHRFELEQIKDDLEELPFPVHVIPGNHEVGNKYSSDSPVAIQQDYLRLYRSVFGPSEWSFEHKNVRFTGFNALLLGSGLEEEKVLRSWLDTQANRPGPERHVWIMHPALFADDPGEPDWDRSEDRRAWYFALDGEHRRYLLEIFRRSGASHLITAHIHCYRHFVLDDMQIHFSPSTAFPQWGHRWKDGDARCGFLHFTVTSESIFGEVVRLSHLSHKRGYGPGGNPPLEGRNYGEAREQPAIDVDENRFPRQ